MAKWQQIDTAPRDGTEILAKIPGYGSGNIISWRWEFECWVIADNLDPPPCWTDGICWERNAFGVPSVQPTHWRPIP